MNQLNERNVDSQGIEYELNRSTHTAVANAVNADATFKRGVSDREGVIYKLTGVNVVSDVVRTIAFPFHRRGEITFATTPGDNVKIMYKA